VHFHICNACEYDGFAQIMVTNYWMLILIFFGGIFIYVHYINKFKQNFNYMLFGTPFCHYKNAPNVLFVGYWLISLCKFVKKF
jgi:hypothetical protein